METSNRKLLEQIIKATYPVFAQAEYAALKRSIEFTKALERMADNTVPSDVRRGNVKIINLEGHRRRNAQLVTKE